MLSKNITTVPENLILLAKKTTSVPVGVVCAHQASAIESAKQAYELDLIQPIFIGDKYGIQKEAETLTWDINSFEIIDQDNDKEAAIIGAQLAKDNKIKVLIKGNLHTDILMRAYLKKEFSLIEGKRLSHIWHMTSSVNKKPLFITDGALNVNPRIEVKMHILSNAVEFAKKVGVSKPRVAVLSGTEDPIESMPSSMEAKEVMERAQKENVDAYVHGPLAFDNAVSAKAAKIKRIESEVAGNADIILVPNIETGNALVKMMVYYMSACAAGVVIGAKVPFVLTSRSDGNAARLASIAAAVICA